MKHYFTIFILCLLSTILLAQNKVLEMKGGNEQVTFVSPISGDDDFTLELWFTGQNGNRTRIPLVGWGEFNESGFNRFQLISENNKLSILDDNFNLGFSFQRTVDVIIDDDNQWHHLAVIKDGNEITIIVDDNQPFVYTSAIANPFDMPSIMYLGKTNRDLRSSWDGQMDELRIWDHARTLAEVEKYRACTLSGSEDGLLLYYDFEETVSSGGQDVIADLGALPTQHGFMRAFTALGNDNFVIEDIGLIDDCGLVSDCTAGYTVQRTPCTSTYTFLTDEKDTGLEYLWEVTGGAMNVNESFTEDTLTYSFDWRTFGANQTSSYEVCLTITFDDGCQDTYCETFTLATQEQEDGTYYEVIAEPQDVTILADAESCTAVTDLQVPSIDICSGTLVSNTHSRSDGLSMSEPFPIGTTNVTVNTTIETLILPRPVLVFTYEVNVEATEECRSEQCDDFNDQNISDWGTIASSISVVSPGASGLDDDYYLRLRDGIGASWTYNIEVFSGDFTVYDSQCFCYDYRLDADGSSDSPTVMPRIYLFQGDPNSPTLEAQFISSVSLMEGDGWHQVCGELSLCTGDDLPSNEQGSWSMRIGEGCEDWNSLLSDVSGVRFFADFTSSISEVHGIDNVCIMDCPSDCFTVETEEIVCNNDLTYDVTVQIKNENDQVFDRLLTFSQSNQTAISPSLSIDFGAGQGTLEPGNISGDITFTIAQREFVAEEVEVCFDVIPQNPEGGDCCKDDFCITLPVCCEPEESKSLAIFPSDIDDCCYDVQISNLCAQNYFKGITAFMTDESMAIMTLDGQNGWTSNNKGDGTVDFWYKSGVDTENSDYVPLYSEPVTVGTVCVDGVTNDNKDDQLLQVDWLVCDENDETIVACSQETATDCEPDPCNLIFNPVVSCDDLGNYQLNFQLQYNSTSIEDRFVQQLVVNPLGNTQISDYSPHTFEQLMMPGMVSSFTLDLFGVEAGDIFSFQMTLHDFSTPLPDGTYWCCYDGQEVNVTIPPCVQGSIGGTPTEPSIQLEPYEIETQVPPSFVVYPNPVRETFVIAFEQPTSEPLQLELVNMQGKLESRLIIPAGVDRYKLDMQQAIPAVHFLRLKNEKGATIGYQKILKL